jgi:hypothetical protein
MRRVGGAASLVLALAAAASAESPVLRYVPRHEELKYTFGGAGALLSFGDGHYAMGDGEIMGTAIEGAMDVELTVDLIKHRDTPWPRRPRQDPEGPPAHAFPLRRDPL